MAEYRKEMAVAAALAVVMALGVGVLAITAFPIGGGSNFAPLLGLVTTRDLSCSLATGTCTMTMVNNSTASLELESCGISVIVSSNGTASTWKPVNGTVGGQATAGIPPGSEVGVTCTVPKSDLTLQNSQSFEGFKVTGGMAVRLEGRWGSYPAGTIAYVSFVGVWS